MLKKILLLSTLVAMQFGYCEQTTNKDDNNTVVIKDNKKNDSNKKKGENKMSSNSDFNKKLLEDAEKLDVSDSKTIEEINKNKINVRSLKTKFAEDIWIVDRKSKSIVFEIRFKNEGKRSFTNDPEMLKLVLETITDGTKTRHGDEISKLMEDKSISISAYADADNIIVTVNCLSKYFNDVMDLLCDLGTNAIFQENKVKIAKDVIVLGLKQSKFDPITLAREKLVSMTFVKPYHTNIDESIKKIQQYDSKYIIENCYNKIFNPENAVITIVGDIKQGNKENNNNSDVFESDIVNNFNKLHDALSSKINKYNTNNPFKSVQQTTELEKCEKKYEHVKLYNPQSIIMFALPGVLRTDEDKIAIRAANNIFGRGGLGSRLFKTVRDQKGLVYYIGVGPLNMDLQSVFVGTAATRPENVNKVIQEVKNQISILYNNGVTESELNDSKVSKYTSHIFATSESLLGFVAALRNDDYVKLQDINNYLSQYLKIKIEDINRALKKVFDPEKLVFVSCGMDTNNISTEQNKQEENTSKNVEKKENKKVDEVKYNTNDQINIKEKVLENGMRVIVAPLSTKNSVCFGVGYFVGSTDDPRITRGISHFMEHMMFKQTKNLENGKIKHYLDKYNKYTNAFTSYDITFYTHQCNKAFLELDMQIEAERMVNIQFDPKEIELEKGAIIEERKMRMESDPYIRYADELMLKSLYLYSPYSEPVIGYMDQIQACNAENLKEHYDKYYMPNNAFALFVGDIDIDEAVELCNKYFGNISKGQEIKRNKVTDPEKIGITNKMTHKSDQITAESITICYKVPQCKLDTMKKELTVSIAQRILASGMSSILYRKLVTGKKILHNISSSLNYFPYDSSILSINALLQEGNNIKFVEQEINKLIEEFKNDLFTKELFETEKQKYIDSFDLMLDNPLELNNYIISQVCSRRSLEEIKNIKSILNTITFDDVKSAIKDIFDINNQALVIYQMPEEKENHNTIQDKAEEIKQKLSEKADQIKETVINKSKEIKNKIKEIKNKTEEKIRS